MINSYRCIHTQSSPIEDIYHLKLHNTCCPPTHVHPEVLCHTTHTTRFFPSTYQAVNSCEAGVKATLLKAEPRTLVICTKLPDKGGGYGMPFRQMRSASLSITLVVMMSEGSQVEGVEKEMRRKKSGSISEVFFNKVPTASKKIRGYREMRSSWSNACRVVPLGDRYVPGCLSLHSLVDLEFIPQFFSNLSDERR